MNESQKYLLRKISKINYKISIHEGNANERLASQTNLIFTLPVSSVPDIYKTKFKRLISLLEKTVENFPGLMTPKKINGIYNKTAIKYIILLIEIEDYLRDIYD